MTDNGSNFNHIKSAGALLLAALIVLGSVLTVAAAAEKQMELPFGSPIYRISNMTV